MFPIELFLCVISKDEKLFELKQLSHKLWKKKKNEECIKKRNSIEYVCNAYFNVKIYPIFLRFIFYPFSVFFLHKKYCCCSIRVLQREKNIDIKELCCGFLLIWRILYRSTWVLFPSVLVLHSLSLFRKGEIFFCSSCFVFLVRFLFLVWLSWVQLFLCSCSV